MVFNDITASSVSTTEEEYLETRDMTLTEGYKFMAKVITDPWSEVAKKYFSYSSTRPWYPSAVETGIEYCSPFPRVPQQVFHIEFTEGAFP